MRKCFTCPDILSYLFLSWVVDHTPDDSRSWTNITPQLPTLFITVSDHSFFDSKAPLQLYESFSKSPVLAQFTFSPTVLEIINRVMPELSPESSLYDLQWAATAVSSEPRRTPSMWKHILALHLRRGHGWEELCDEKGRQSA